MKVIFLDIDGVLNSKYFFILAPDGRISYGDKRTLLDKRKIAILNRIIEETGAVCVLSSSWRTLNPADKMLAMLKDRGFVGEVIDRTPTNATRGLEIRDWLVENEDVEQFVILDDSNDMEPYLNRLVRPYWNYGLSDEHADVAIKILNEGPSKSKMYILVKEDVPLGFAMTAVSHASLAMWMKFERLEGCLTGCLLSVRWSARLTRKSSRTPRA